MARSAARLAIVLAVLALVPFVLPGVGATLGLAPTSIDLGKIDPGHKATRYVNVTNSGSAEVQVSSDVICGCGDYVTVDPASFPLTPGKKRQVRIDVDVAQDAEPGIHDYQIRFVEMAAAGSGGTAQGAQGLGLQFQVRTAGLFITFPDAKGNPTYDLRSDGSLGFRFFNGFESELDVTVTGTVQLGDTERSIGPVTFTAPAGGAAASVADERIQTGLTSSSDPGVYTVTLSAAWTDRATGRSGPSTGSVTVPIGADASVKDFRAEIVDGAVAFTGTLVNEGGTSLDVRMIVEVSESGRPDVARYESDEVRLGAGEEREVTARWDGASGAQYTATAFAAFRVAGDPSGAVTEAERTEAKSIDLGGGAGKDDDGDSGDDGGTTTILLAALVGILIGGAVAFVVIRKKK